MGASFTPTKKMEGVGKGFAPTNMEGMEKDLALLKGC